MNDAFSSMLPSAAVLGAACAIALFLTVHRSWAAEAGGLVRGAARVALVAVVAQAAHFVEELLTGFYVRFPALFGLGVIPVRFFIFFNVAWLVIWSLSCWGLIVQQRAALFPLYFLAIAAALNGVAHPLISVYVEGYFPGLVTSPLVGVMGVVLLRRLLVATTTAPSPGRASPADAQDDPPAVGTVTTGVCSQTEHDTRSL